MNNPLGWPMIGLVFARVIGAAPERVIDYSITFAMVCVFAQNPM